MASNQMADAIRPVRFGIMCNGLTFAAWEADCIRQLLALENVSPALLIKNDQAVARLTTRERLRGALNPAPLVWKFYQRLILNGRSLAMKQVDLSPELGSVPVIACDPLLSGKYVQRLRPEDIKQIRDHDLDFILRFSFNILKGDVLTSAKCGIWSFHHGDPETYRGTPPGFWEIYHQDPVTGTVLQRLTERLDAGVMLHKGFFRTDLTSYVRNRDNILLGATDWPARLCKQLQHGPIDALEAEPSRTQAKIYRTPNSFQMLRYGVQASLAWCLAQWRTLVRVQQWGVAVIDAPLAEVAGLRGEKKQGTALRSASWLPEKPGEFLADPFGMWSDGRLTVFAERYDWSEEIGSIAVYDCSDPAKPKPHEGITEQTHLSYPFVLNDGGKTLCVPESSASGEVAAYAFDKRSKQWVKSSLLMNNVAIVDPTLLKHSGLWWLFGTRADKGDNLKLYAWYATDPKGPWLPHLANPLKTDIRSSRPAGAFFEQDGKLFRPAQDCSTGYGAATVVAEVEKLSPTEFAERVVSRLEPDPSGPYRTGLHTLNGVGPRTLIDGSRNAFMWPALRSNIRRKVRRLLSQTRR